ncbi:type II toxin-antitoxin system Phd/YefM family antitoxin [Sphingomonas sp. RS2018]
MNKIVSASEFKAKCLRMIEEMQADGVPITITKRGKVVAEVKPKGEERLASLYGVFRSPGYHSNWDPEAPATDPGDWEALR